MTLEWAGAGKDARFVTVRCEALPDSMHPPRAALLAFAAVLAAPAALAQTGQQKYVQWCQGCHGNPSNNKDNVLGGKDWTIIKLAMDTKPTMTADLRPAYDAGLLTDDDFMLISGYLQTFGGGVTSQLSMPAAIGFGTVSVGGASSIVTRNVSSTGNAAVQIATVTSSNPTEFPITSRTCTDGAFVNPGTSCSVSVQFKPAAAGARTGQITVSSNGVGSPQSFSVSGTGQSVAPPPPPASGLNVPSTLGLGSQAVGGQSAGTALSVSNPGASAVTVTGVQTSSVVEFPILGISCGTVAAGASCNVTVGFKPQSAGARNGTLTITTNGAGSPHTVTLSGTGTAPAQQATKVTVVEYFNAGFGHYFTTADADEIGGLDAGAFNFAFLRTSRQFNAWNGPSPGTVPVCRFFTTPGTFGTKSSHFYTADAAECEGLKANPNWQYEKIAFHIAVPSAGACPAGTIPVYRMYNNGQTAAPNHRFTADFATYQEFTTTKGWAVEGVGFCSPP